MVSQIRRNLKKVGLETDPDFEFAYIDEPIKFVARKTRATPSKPTEDVTEQQEPFVVASALADPTYRIGKLPSANGPLISVHPQATIAEAVTVMLERDFSQLPVMQGDYTLKGVVGWKSIGRELSLGHPCTKVSECLEEAVVIGSDTSLFSAIPTIVDKEYVLVRESTNRIQGIVTTSDLSLQFRQLAEPFLLLGEIENHLRRLGDGKFTRPELCDARDPADAGRQVNDLADLTFGEHIRLLENPARWAALGLQIDRTAFIRHLNAVREVRNSVMHFDPDGVAPEELDRLRGFTRLLGALKQR